MRFWHPNFSISDKTRQLAFAVTALCLLAAILRVYSIPIEKIPIIDVPVNLVPKVDGKPVLGLSTVAAIAAIYYFLVYTGEYLSEFTRFTSEHIEAAQLEYESFERKRIDRNTESGDLQGQSSQSMVSDEYRRNAVLSMIGGWFRAVIYCLVPIFLVLAVVHAEAGNILSVVLALVYSGSGTT